MKVVLETLPTLEPVTLAELKTQLRLDTGTIADNSTEIQSIYPGSHAITTGYTLIGDWGDVGGVTSTVNLFAGTNGVGGTVDVKIQESDNLTIINDWTGGAFTQVTESNDNTSYEKTYSGTKRYIRTVAHVAVAACEFSTLIQTWSIANTEDSLLEELITTGRLAAENDLNRKIMQQEWNYYISAWPLSDRIKIPFGSLQSVTTVLYKDINGVGYTLVENTDFIVEKNGEQCGFLILPSGVSWPQATLYPSNPIAITFVCGYATQADVPAAIKQAVKRWCVLNYADLGDGRPQNVIDGKTYEMLIDRAGRLYDRDFL
jgi:uncharacterized phiE125 gp8 family phage protein